MPPIKHIHMIRRCIAATVLALSVMLLLPRDARAAQSGGPSTADAQAARTVNEVNGPYRHLYASDLSGPVFRFPLHNGLPAHTPDASGGPG